MLLSYINQTLFWTQLLSAGPLTILWLFFSILVGLSVLVAFSESLSVILSSEFWKKFAQLWQRILFVSVLPFGLVLLLAVGILTFHWQGLWPHLTWWSSLWPVGLQIGLTILSILCVWLSVKSWNKLSPQKHMHLSWFTSVSLALVAWVPIALESWRECPLATGMSVATEEFVVSQISWVLLSPLTVIKFFLMMFCSWTVGGSILLAVSGWFLSRKGMNIVVRQCLWAGIGLTLFSACFSWCFGDRVGYLVAQQQPMKMAALQGLQRGGTYQAFQIVGPVQVPMLLSRLATHIDHGFVPGKQDVLEGGYALPEGGTALSWQAKKAQALQSNVQKERQTLKHRHYAYASVTNEQELLPSGDILFWTFRILILLGVLVLLVPIIIFWLQRVSYPWARKILPILLYVPLPCVCLLSFCGWLISEIGMMPWAVTDMLFAKDAITICPQTVLIFETIAVLFLSLTIGVWGIRRLRKTLTYSK